MQGTTAIRCFVSRVPIAAWFVIVVVALCAGCGRPKPVTGVTSIKAANPAELQRFLLTHKPEVAQFRLRGPLPVTERRDLEIPLGSDMEVDADLFLSTTTQKAPLVIILHGHGNSKEDHEFQAMHMASWGMHGMAIELPAEGPWIANGRTLARLVKLIHRKPEILDSHIDPERIILVGHSFGATAVATALAEGAPAIGGVLLDPAGIGRQLPDLLKRVRTPILVIGADEEIWSTRNRTYFYRFIPAAVGEISIRDAAHEDAQYPTDNTQRTFSDHPLATEDAQITFVSALSASAFGLAATGGIDYAWNSFEDALKKGQFFNARRK